MLQFVISPKQIIYLAPKEEVCNSVLSVCVCVCQISECVDVCVRARAHATFKMCSLACRFTSLIVFPTEP